MSPDADRRALFPLVAAAAVSLVGGLGLAAWYWPGGLPYDVTSGVWTTLADDLVHGQFYRPVDGPLGSGGTRYMPLFFVLQAALMAVGVPAVVAGMAVVAASIALLGFGAFRLMRALGATPLVAGSCVALLPASIAFQLLTLSIKADLLAAALSVAGLVAALRWQEVGRRRDAALACLAFAAALLAKFTNGFALGAVVLWLLARRRPGAAGAFAAGTAALVALAMVIADRASDGRMAEAFAACATGGVSLDYGLKFLWWFACVAVQDPFFLALFVAAVVAAVRRWRRGGVDLPVCYFAVTTVGTVLIFASPGTDSNHLVDLLVASVVLLALEIAHAGLGRGARWAAGLFAAAVVATWLPGVPSVRHFLLKSDRPTRAAVAEIAARFGPDGTRRLLAENPLLPLLLGQRPEVLDSFSLRLVAARDPAVRAEFLGRLAARRYSAVVLQDWSGAPAEERWQAIEAHTSLGVERFYGEVHFSPGFLETLQAHYRLSFVAGTFVIFEPRPR